MQKCEEVKNSFVEVGFSKPLGKGMPPCWETTSINIKISGAYCRNILNNTIPTFHKHFPHLPYADWHFYHEPT